MWRMARQGALVWRSHQKRKSPARKPGSSHWPRPIQIVLEATFETEDTSNRVVARYVVVNVGDFRLDEQVLNRVELEVRRGFKHLAVGISELQVPLELVVERYANSTPNCPVAPAALRAMNNAVRRGAGRGVLIRAGVLVQLIA